MDIQALELVTKTIQALRDAGEIILLHRNRPKNVRQKGRIDLITETDVAVENALKEDLGTILPEASFLAEETAGQDKPGSLTWIIDPLDGTTNFVHDLPAVAISVALWNHGQVEMGIVYLPVLNEMFHAVRSQGAYLNGRPISVSRTDDPEKALIATGFPYTIREDLRPVLDNLENILFNCLGLRRFGAAAMDLAYTAAGRFDAFFETMLHPWDVAAGWLLVQEAGGRISRYDGREYEIGAKTILASNGLVHNAISDMLGTTP